MPNHESVSHGGVQPAPRPAPVQNRISRKTLQWFQAMSTVVLGLAGMILSAVIGFSSLYSNRQAAERQIQGQIAAVAMQRQIAGANLAATLLQTIVKGTDPERNLGLKVLASLAPDQAEQIGNVVLRSTRSTPAQQQIRAMINASIVLSTKREFEQHLENAKKYREFSLDASACREYFLAYDNLPATSREKVQKRVEDAKADYERGKFTDAADKLGKALNP